MQTRQAYRDVRSADSALKSMDESERIALAKETGTAAALQPTRVSNAWSIAPPPTNAGSVEMENSLGLCAERSSNSSMIYAMPSVQDGEEVQTGFAFRMGQDAGDIEGCAAEAVQSALEKLGGTARRFRLLPRTAETFCGLRPAWLRFPACFRRIRRRKGLSLLAG